MSASNCEFISDVLKKHEDFTFISKTYRIKSQLSVLLWCITLWAALMIAPHMVTQSDTPTGNFLLSTLSEYFILIWFIYAVYRWFADGQKAYCIRENEVSFKHGLFCRALISTPVKRIQHISIEQGFLDRIFKLSTLSIRSAGVGFSIAGISTLDAENIRKYLLAMVEVEQHD